MIVLSLVLAVADFHLTSGFGLQLTSRVSQAGIGLVDTRIAQREAEKETERAVGTYSPRVSEPHYFS